MVAVRRVRDPATRQMTSAADIRRHLCVLAEERVLAHECGLDHDRAYMADLESEIAVTSAAFVGEAVTEIACLRATLDGILQG
jgi:hypothetical protein